MTSILLVIFGIGTLLLRAGFALQAAGSLRARNSASIILRLTADTAAGALAFWAFGAGIFFQTHSRYFGFDARFLLQEPATYASREFFHITLCIIGGAICTGAIAERSKFYVGAIASALLGGAIFPIAGHWMWVARFDFWGRNFIDYGGASVIHLAGAIFGAIGVAAVGSRTGKYDKDGSSNFMPGHSLPMVGIGTLLLLAGWFPYLIGCVGAHWLDDTDLGETAIAVSATNILLAAAGGVVGGLFYSQYRYRKPNLFFAYSGLIGGLVAISAGLAVVTSLGAVAIGFIAGILVPVVAHWLDQTARLDDPIGLIAIHGVGAVWGVTATAIFMPLIYFPDHFKLLAIQCGGLVIVILLASIVAGVLFITLKKFNQLRVPESEEIDGTDSTIFPHRDVRLQPPP